MLLWVKRFTHRAWHFELGVLGSDVLGDILNVHRIHEVSTSYALVVAKP